MKGVKFVGDFYINGVPVSPDDYYRLEYNQLYGKKIDALWEAYNIGQVNNGFLKLVRDLLRAHPKEVHPQAKDSSNYYLPMLQLLERKTIQELQTEENQ